MSKYDKTQDKNGDIARNIWLAGLGAYGRAFDEAVHRYEKASKDSPKLFKELVKRGQELEKETRSKVNQSDLGRTTSTLEERLKQVRANLSPPLGLKGDIERLESKLDALSDKLDRILESGTSKSTRKAPPRAKAKKKDKAKTKPRARSARN